MDMARMLISEFRANANLRGGIEERTQAARNGEEDIALALINEFVNCDTKIFGATLLHDACRGGCPTLAKVLI